MVDVAKGELVKGLNYVGKCYDILSLDPLNMGGSAKGANAIDVAREGVTTYEQGGYAIPQGTLLQSPFNTEITTFRSLINNTFDFQKEFSLSLGISAGVEGLFSFSASSSYKEIEQVTQSRKQVFTYGFYYVQNHIVSLQLDHPDELRLGRDFAARVRALPTERKKDYEKFIEDFGTHFTTTVSLGGMAYSRASTLTIRVQSSKEREVGFKSEATATIKKFTGGANVETSQKSVEKSDKENEIERTSLFFRGGTGNVEVSSSWFESLKERPAPIPRPGGTHLERLSTLLTPQFFPDDTSIDDKRKLLEQAIDSYLLANGATLDGTIHYGDKLYLFYPILDQDGTVRAENQLYIDPATKNLYFLVAGRRPDPNHQAVTAIIVDPQGQSTQPGEAPQEVLSNPDRYVNLQIENFGFLTNTGDLEGSRITTVRPVPDSPQNPRSQWSLRFVGDDFSTSSRSARPLVSGDHVFIIRHQEGTKDEDQRVEHYFTLLGRQKTQNENYNLAAVRTSTDLSYRPDPSEPDTAPLQRRIVLRRAQRATG